MRLNGVRQIGSTTWRERDGKVVRQTFGRPLASTVPGSVH